MGQEEENLGVRHEESEGGRRKQEGEEGRKRRGSVGEANVPPPSVLVMCKVGSRDLIVAVNITTWMRVIIIIESLGASSS